LEKEITLLGIYHSHPDHPAVPSKHDLKQAVPFFSYLILSTEQERVKKVTSWQLYHEQFEEEEIEIENKFEMDEIFFTFRQKSERLCIENKLSKKYQVIRISKSTSEGLLPPIEVHFLPGNNSKIAGIVRMTPKDQAQNLLVNSN